MGQVAVLEAEAVASLLWTRASKQETEDGTCGVGGRQAIKRSSSSTGCHRAGVLVPPPSLIPRLSSSPL